MCPAALTMTKKNIRYSNDIEAELGKLLRSLARRYRLWEVFSDFVAVCALTISNAVDKRNSEAREAEYMRIIGRYEHDEVQGLCSAFARVVEGMEVPGDLLGGLFMKLEISDSWKGQFFTPYELCKCMAVMTLNTGELQQAIKGKGFITVCDPAVGGGATLIAYAEMMREAGFNPQRQVHMTGVDIDITAVHMAYVQLSLLGVPAVIVHGNSLAMTFSSEWRTPMHQLHGWDWKLRSAEKEEQPIIETVAATADFVWPQAKPRLPRAA